MAIGTNTGVQNPYGQGDYKITLSSTETLRKFLLGKNLQSSYLADGNPLPAPFGVQAPGEFSYQNLSDNFVIDQKTVLETGTHYQTNLFLDNSYGPAGGYKDVQLIDVKKVLPRAQSDYVSPNTLQPKSFVASVYTPQEILDTVNITNGIVNTVNDKVLNDSKLAQNSSGYLRENLGALQAQYLYEISSDGSGNANISTDPRSNQIQGTDFISRISNMYYGYSDIPGNYFQETFVPDINDLQLDGYTQGATFQNIQATASAIGDLLSGGQGIPTNPFSIPNPSDTFINYMGEESQKALFGSLTFNTYRPDYSRVALQSGVENVVPFYYVGSKESEPGKIQSPLNAVPADKFGRSTGALVYGPSTLAKELETVNGLPLWYFYNFGGAYEGQRVFAVDPGNAQWDGIGPERAIGCVVYPACEIVEPGIVQHISGNKFTLGEPSGERTQRIENLSQALISANMKAPVRPRIRDEIWIKLWGNLSFNPISSLTCATLEEIAEDQGTRTVVRDMMIEAQAVGEALGVKFPVSVEKRINGAGAVGAHKTSMLQDLELGRPMEIDALVASVSEMGAMVGVKTPTINTILALVRQRARIAGCY